MRKYIKVYAKWIAILPLIGLCSCSSVALHSDFTNYPSVYAKASDEQLLLNLARLSNDEPVSFSPTGSDQFPVFICYFYRIQSCLHGPDILHFP